MGKGYLKKLRKRLHQCYFILRSLRPRKNKFIVDCGAFTGDSIPLLRLFFNADNDVIHAFEPDPVFAPYLNLIKVVYHPEAVWIHNDGVDFYKKDMWPGNSVYADKCDGEKIRVPSVDFSKWIENHKGKYIIVKMDIEGAEYEVLQKMIDDDTLKYIKELYIEWHWNKWDKVSYEEHKALLKKVKKETKVFRYW